jgi:hypothetical protein
VRAQTGELGGQLPLQADRGAEQDRQGDLGGHGQDVLHGPTIAAPVDARDRPPGRLSRRLADRWL